MLHYTPTFVLQVAVCVCLRFTTVTSLDASDAYPPSVNAYLFARLNLSPSDDERPLETKQPDQSARLSTPSTEADLLSILLTSYSISIYAGYHGNSSYSYSFFFAK